MNPKWRLKIVHVNVECGQRNVILDAKVMVGLGEAISKLRTIHVAEQTLLGSAGRANGNVHFGRNTAQNAEISIDVRLDG